MTQSHKTLVVIIASVALVVGGLIALSGQPAPVATKPGQYDALAECLTSKSVKFYGAYWCPHCQNQKATLGESAMKKIDYIECGVQGNLQGITDVCKTAGVDTFPTWTFADGSRLVGEQKLTTIAEKAGCPMPASRP